eukprot:1874251-Pyramimonas_sp.AAC.1
MGRAPFFLECLFPRVGALEPALRDRTMLEVLRALPALTAEDKKLPSVLSSLPFVPTQQLVDGVETLQTPSNLYDPRVPELAALLDPSTCFPAPPFASQEVLGALQVTNSYTCVALNNSR